MNKAVITGHKSFDGLFTITELWRIVMTEKNLICVKDINMPVFPKPARPNQMININGYTEISCDKCGNKLLKSNYRITKAKNHFCCVACSDLWKKTAFLGENSPQYGKKSSEDTKQKQSIAMKKRWKNPAYIGKVLSAREKSLREYQKTHGYPVGWSPEAIEKRKQSYVENYGTSHNWSNEECRQKCEETTIQLYGSGSLEMAKAGITKDVIERRRRSLITKMTGLEYQEYLEHLPIKDAYYKAVRRFTEQQPIDLLEDSEKRARMDDDPNAYHLDHIVPISYGFLNGIPPEEIADISNLRFIPWLENIQKSNKLLEE